jgi:hypothetical protein
MVTWMNSKTMTKEEIIDLWFLILIGNEIKNTRSVLFFRFQGRLSFEISAIFLVESLLFS